MQKNDDSKSANQAKNIEAWKIIRQEPERALALAREVQSSAPVNKVDLAFSFLVEGTYLLEHDAPTRALRILKKSLNLFQKIGDRVGEARALDSLGWLYYVRGENTTAIEYIQKGLSLREHLGDPQEIADSLNGLSAVYSEFGKQPEALEILLRAVGIAEETGNLGDQCRFQGNMAVLYTEAGDYEYSEELLLHTLYLAYQMKDQKRIAFLLTALGEVNLKLENFDAALDYVQKALKSPADAMPVYIRATIKNITGKICTAQGKFDEALVALDEGITLAKEIGDLSTLSDALLAKGSLLLEKKQTREALPLLKQALRFAEKAPSFQIMYLVHEKMAVAYHDLKQYRLAYRHLQLYQSGIETANTREAKTHRRLLEIRHNFHRTREEREVADKLRQASSVMTGSMNFEQVLRLLLEQAREIVDFDAAALIQPDGERIQIIGQSSLEKYGMDMSQPTMETEKFPLPAKILKIKKPLVIPNTMQFPEWNARFVNGNVSSALCVPLQIGDMIVAVLILFSARPYAYQARHAIIMTSFAGHANLALKNALLFEEVQRSAMTDGLTGLYNRNTTLDMAEREIKRSSREYTPLCVVMLDVDRFKSINDTYGHQFGDRVLQSVSGTLRMSLRAYDIVGRYGGDEFLIVLPNSAMNQAAVVIERLRNAISSLTFPMPDGIVRISVSIGVTERGGNADDIDSLVYQADQALYRAKREGRNRASEWIQSASSPLVCL